jgi:hypothetical protein
MHSDRRSGKEIIEDAGSQASQANRQASRPTTLGHIRWLKCLLIIQWTGKCQRPLTFFTAAHSGNGRLHCHGGGRDDGGFGGGGGANAMRKPVRQAVARYPFEDGPKFFLGCPCDLSRNQY